MNENSVLCRFIEKHPDDWENILSRPPYSIRTTHSGPLCIFKYNMYSSDFTLKEVQEARGIIINTDTLETVCFPFRKFGNYGEPYADKIDWSTARVTEKIDGSIIKVWYNKLTEAWQISTDSVIDAAEAELTDYITGSKTNFKELFLKAADGKLDYSRLSKDKTYIFELISPINTIVIKYTEHDIYHIGTRHNKTGQETVEDIGIKHPKSYALTSLDECIAFAESLKTDKEYDTSELAGVSFEGVVVNDAHFNRIKVKSFKYVLAHSKACNHISKQDIIRLILNGEAEETAAYFPALRPKIEHYLNGFNRLTEIYSSAEKEAKRLFEECDRNRGLFAAEWKKQNGEHYGFRAIEGVSPAEYISELQTGQLIGRIENTINLERRV